MAFLAFAGWNNLTLSTTFTSDSDLDWLQVGDPATPQVYVFAREHFRDDGLNVTRIFDQTTSTNSQTFTYSDADRLATALGVWGSLTYAWDLAGNRMEETLFSGSTTDDVYAYVSGTNRLDTITENGTLSRSFTPDAAGNIVAETRGGTSYAYLHNDNGRLSEIDVAGSLSASYVYDGFERLSIRTTVTPAVTTHYVSDPAGHILAEADDTGATQREYIWLDDRPLAVVADVPTTPVVYYVHTDHLERPVRMTDGSKAVVWSAEWLSEMTPFGQAAVGEVIVDYSPARGGGCLRRVAARRELRAAMPSSFARRLA